MEKIICIFCLFLALLCNSLYGQHKETDPKAHKALVAAQQKFNSLNDLTVTVKYTLKSRTNPNEAPLSKTGTLKVKKKNFKIELPDQLLLTDGQTIWNYLKSENEVNISKYDPEEAMSLDNLFKLYRDDMKARYDDIETSNGKQLEKITMFPLQNDLEYFKIEIWIDKTIQLPARMAIWGRNGGVAAYELSNFKTNTGLTDSEFIFDKTKYPNVEVVDLRK
jgi:outer membrane lipoprotein-sorting protein